MIEKVTLDNALANFTQGDSMDYVVGLVSGKGCRKDDKPVRLSAKTLIRIAQVTIWERIAILCLIGSSDGASNSLLRITGTLKENNKVQINAVRDDSNSIGVKLLYRLTNGTLSLYLYSTLNIGSSNPIAIISSHPIVNEGSTTDISGYTELSL